MKVLLKITFLSLIFIIGSQQVYGQASCCSKSSAKNTNCDPTIKGSEKATNKACCSSATKEATSGCTPSNCRGAKTKFGEAQVISDLRSELVSLKAKMESSQELKFSESSISVHDIIGETDDESLEIIANHIAIIESEISSLTNHEIASQKIPENKAIQLKQLKERISFVANLL